jgi:hypothetical protein
LQDLVVPEAQDDEPVCGNPLITAPVVHRGLVLPSIHLDYQMMLKADEIDDVRTDRALPPKPHSRGAA